MKFTIEHSRTKRNIEGPFNICGSEEDLRHMAKQILNKLGPIEGVFCYGWVEITEKPIIQSDVRNTEPVAWDEDIYRNIIQGGPHAAQSSPQTINITGCVICGKDHTNLQVYSDKSGTMRYAICPEKEEKITIIDGRSIHREK